MKLSNETKRIQKARAVFEVVKKRLTYKNYNDEIKETDVVDRILPIPKAMQKTFFAAEAPNEFKWIQVIDDKPMAYFHEDELLVVE